ncbi:hypothetical protein SO802_022823 [Lithocarpus litseifolius]|uniref:Uncharacterized protein n=1 Tax=Lithocarpus litseifolius TaxID=425828 RepID=A0AAW2CA10_9ROSI
MPVILGDNVSTDTWLNGSSSSYPDLVCTQQHLQWVIRLLRDQNASMRIFQRLIHQNAFKRSPRLKDDTTFSPFTEKGDQYARINSKFLSTKGIKEEESNLEEKKYSAESFKTDPPKSFKREPDTEDKKSTSILHGKKGDQHSTSSVVHSQDGPAKCQLKPDYEQLKLVQGKTLMKLASYATPTRKKGNLKGSGDKTIRPIFMLWEKLVLCTLLCNSLCICCTLYINFINFVVSVASYR